MSVRVSSRGLVSLLVFAIVFATLIAKEPLRSAQDEPARRETHGEPPEKAAEPPVDPVERLQRAEQLASAGKTIEAISELDRAIRDAPKLSRAYRLRAALRSDAGKHDDAAADWARVIELDPEDANALDRRGDSLLKAGRASDAVACFDAFLERRPDFKPHHWRRGIALYWAGSYKEGAKQFEGYQTVDSNDVENGVWHLLCVARAEGLAKARESALSVRSDPRVPLAEVWELFLGRGSESAVLRAVDAGEPSERELRARRFYAHLYLGLFADIEGRLDRAIEHLELAVERHPLPGYMHDVARVHLERLKSEKKRRGEKKSGREG